MKNLLIFFFIIFTAKTWAVCSSPISRTNNSPNTVLTSTKYNLDLNTVYTRANELPGDCVTDGTVTKAKLATGAKDHTILSKTTTYTVLNSDQFIKADATSAGFTLNLPTAANISGRTLIIKKVDSSTNLVTIDPSGAETIDGSSTYELGMQYQSVTLVSDGTNWFATHYTPIMGLVGDSYFAGTASCTWTKSGTSIGPYDTNASCPGPTIGSTRLGSWQTTDVNLPEQTVNSLPKGRYRAVFTGTGFQSVGSTSILAINDGTTTCEPVGGSSPLSLNVPFTVSCSFVYTTGGNRSFELYTASDANTVNLTNSLTSPRASLKFQLFYEGPN